MLNHPSGMLKSRRLVFFLNTFALGGAARQALLVGRHLRLNCGATVVFCALKRDGPLSSLCRQNGIDAYVLGYPTQLASGFVRDILVQNAFYMGLARRRLFSRVRSLRPEVLMPFDPETNRLFCPAWQETGASVCIWNERMSGTIVDERVWMEAKVANASLVVCNSYHAHEFMTKELSIPCEKVHVVRNGVTLAPVEAERLEWRRRLQLTERDFVGCMVGLFRESKDHAMAVRAWQEVVARLRPHGVRAVLLLAGGDTRTLPAVRGLVSSLGMDESVKFLGEVRDISGLLGAVEIVVHCAFEEGCPNAVLEGMAAGRAVVGTDIPGSREALGDEGNGFLVASGDIEGLAKAIVKLACEPDLRAVHGQRNRERIKSLFDVQRMGDEFARLISEVLVNKP